MIELSAMKTFKTFERHIATVSDKVLERGLNFHLFESEKDLDMTEKLFKFKVVSDGSDLSLSNRLKMNVLMTCVGHPSFIIRFEEGDSCILKFTENNVSDYAEVETEFSLSACAEAINVLFPSGDDEFRYRTTPLPIGYVIKDGVFSLLYVIYFISDIGELNKAKQGSRYLFDFDHCEDWSVARDIFIREVKNVYGISR